MRSTTLWTLAAGLMFVGGFSACSDDSASGGETPSSGSSNNAGGETGTGGEGGGDRDPGEAGPTALDDRVIDFNEALRTASLKLNDRLPTLEQIERVQNAEDQATAYADELELMFEDPAFARRMVRFWQDTMLMGGGANGNQPSRDTAPTLAARIMVEGLPYTDLFTTSESTCPTFDEETSTFVDGDCDNGVDVHAGVLTNPGVMHQFYGNMAFRRARWVQEVFLCNKFPAEFSETTIDKGGKDYVSPWAFESISDTPIDFLDYESVVCANCHSSMNHIAPLFAYFDQNGQLQPDIAVLTPLSPEPVPTELSHWLPAGEETAWRYDVPVADLPELGDALAADPEVALCAVTRMWNFTMSKEDVIAGLATVPYEVIDTYYEEFDANGYDLKETLHLMFLSEDFVSF